MKSYYIVHIISCFRYFLLKICDGESVVIFGRNAWYFPTFLILKNIYSWLVPKLLFIKLNFIFTIDNE